MVVSLPSEPTALDYISAGSWNAAFVASQMFEHLLDLDMQQNIHPNLAYKWNVNEADKSIEFWLVRNVTWHDGVPMTAADVKYSIEEIESKISPDTVGLMNGTRVDIVDDYTVIVRPKLWIPAAILYMFATTLVCIYPKHILEGQNLDTTTFHSNPVGTGPFMFKEWVKGDHITLVRNPNYWRQSLPYLDSLVITIIPDASAFVSSYQTGAVDLRFRGVPYALYDTLKSMPNTEVYATKMPSYKLHLTFNLRPDHKITANPLVREAISYAINRSQLANAGTAGVGGSDQIGGSMLFFGVPNSPDTPYNYDPNKAEQLLDKAGYAKGSSGTRFSLTITYRRGEPEEGAVVEVLRDQLSKVGIDLKLQMVDFATLIDMAWNSYNYDVWILKDYIDSQGIENYNFYDSQMILKGAGWSNSAGYSNSAVDNLLMQYLIVIDPNMRQQVAQALDAAINRDLPLLYLYDVIWVQVKRTTFQGPDVPLGIFQFYETVAHMYWTQGSPTNPRETQVQTTSTAPETMTSTAAAQAGSDVTIWVVSIIAIVVIVAVAVWLRRKRKSS